MRAELEEEVEEVMADLHCSVVDGDSVGRCVGAPGVGDCVVDGVGA